MEKQENNGIGYRIATTGDTGRIVHMFWDHLESNSEYISHGEIQMGIAIGPGILALDGREK